MREVKFSIDHINCWGPKSTKKFPETEAELRSVPIIKSTSNGKLYYSCLFRFSSPHPDELSQFTNYVSAYRGMRDVRLLERTKNSALVMMTNAWRESGFKKNVFETILHNNCHILEPLKVENGLEHWHVVTENPREVTMLLTELDEIGEVKIDRLGKYNPDKHRKALTEKQENALRLAYVNGYYTWPRKITLDELAAMAGVSRAAYQDHLRKAESKIIPETLEQKLF